LLERLFGKLRSSSLISTAQPSKKIVHDLQVICKKGKFSVQKSCKKRGSFAGSSRFCASSSCKICKNLAKLARKGTFPSKNLAKSKSCKLLFIGRASYNFKLPFSTTSVHPDHVQQQAKFNCSSNRSYNSYPFL